MPASVVQSATGGATATTVTATLGATPTSGNTLLIIVSSDITVATPSGYTSRASAVGGQGFYIFTKLCGGSESTSQSVNPDGANNTSIIVAEISGTFDKVSSPVDQTDGTLGTTRTITSLSPTTADGLTIAAVGLHSLAAGTLSGFSFNNSFGSIITGPQQGGADAAAALAVAASRVTSTTGAIGTTTASWTNNAADRYGVHVAFTALAGPTTFAVLRPPVVAP